jgi:hypothetical protein
MFGYMADLPYVIGYFIRRTGVIFYTAPGPCDNRQMSIEIADQVLLRAKAQHRRR